MNYNILNYPKETIDRFWSNVTVQYNIDKTVNFDACMEWTGGRYDFGYGKFYLGNYKSIRAHRFSYMCFNGEIPEKFYICHSCDNPSCVNPNHLWLGTHQDNDQDKVKKQRSTIGIKNPMVKLTEEDVLEITNLFELYSDEQIGDLFGVGHMIICNIRNGRNWSHITGIQPTPLKFTKLTDDVVRLIKPRLKFESCSKIAKELGTSYRTILNIKNGTTFKHVV